MGTSVSQIIVVTTPPQGAAPSQVTNLSVSSVSTTGLILSWTAPTFGTQPFIYQAQIAPAGVPPVWANIGLSGTPTSVPVSGLTANTTYQFQVIASNSTGNSFSSVLTATTLSLAPGQPTGLALVGSPSQTSVNLQWNSPAGTPPLTYQVLSRTPSGVGSYVSLGPSTTAMTQTVSGLTASTTYDFEVVATNLAGAGPASTPLLDVITGGSVTGTIPGPATGLVVTNLAPTTLTLSWAAPAVGTQPFTYQPQMALAGASPTWANIGSLISGLTVPVTGLAANTAYQFQIITSNSAGSSSSATLAATTPSVVPGAPTGLAVTGSPTQTSVGLQWTAPTVGTPPLTYQVSLRTPSGSGAFSAAGASTTGVSQTITGLTPSTSYDFEVSAANNAGSGALSAILTNIATAAVVVGVAPGPATGLTTASIAATTLTLSWTAPAVGSAPLTYQPQFAPAGSSPTWTNIGGGISATSVNASGLTPNTAYQFQVVTSNSTGSSTSATVSATTLSVLPGAPTGLTAGTATSTSVPLSWSAPAVGTPPLTYQVSLRTPSGSGAFTAIGGSTATLAQTVSGLAASTGYDFEVSATNGAGTGPQSAILANVVTAPAPATAPGPATALVASAITTTSLTLTWTGPSTGTAPFTYQPQRSAPSPTLWSNIGSPISGTTVSVTGLTANTTYQFQIITSNSAGSSTSATLNASTLAILPSAPTSLAAGTVTQTTVPLTWAAPATGSTPFTYQVSLRSPSGSGAFSAAGAATASLSQIVSGLAASTSYDFEVNATNVAGAGPQSTVLANIVTLAVVTGTAPGPATGLTVSALAPTTLTLSWTAPSTGTTPFTYQAQFAPAGSSPTWSNIGSPISAITVSVSGLTPNTAYQFQVMALNSIGSSTSATVSATTLSVLPAAPTGLAVTGTPTQTTVALQWTAPAVGTPPLTYQVSLRSPSGSGGFSPAGATTASLTQTITGLAAGSTYDFEVRASNLAGAGPQSAVLANVATAPAPATAPSSPTNLASTAIGSSSVAISWSPPAAGTPPFSYIVQYRLH